jgi:hypothetical protein
LPEIRNISYFRDKQKHEADIILEINGRTVPIEVKYQNHIYDHDFKNLLYFMHPCVDVSVNFQQSCGRLTDAYIFVVDIFTAKTPDRPRTRATSI